MQDLEGRDQMIAKLQREKAPALRALKAKLNSEAAFVDGSLDVAREKLIRWLDDRMPETCCASWIEMEEIVEEAATSL